MSRFSAQHPLMFSGRNIGKATMGNSDGNVDDAKVEVDFEMGTL